MKKALTLVDLLKERNTPNHIGVTFIEGSDKEEFFSYQELYNLSLQVLSFLQEQGLKLKDELVFQLDDNKTFVVVFWACILGGIIPVPLTLGNNDDHRQKLFNVWRILNNPYLIISTDNLDKLQKHARISYNLDLFSVIQQKVINVDSIYSCKKPCSIAHPSEDDIAYIQFSSGSTGNPKGVILTHKNLVTNIDAIGLASGYLESDSKMSWMPLTHDMGLIGFHLCPLYWGMNHFLIPTNLFIRRPTLWLDKATQHKATILCSPNFGYKYLLKQMDKSSYNWDLSNVRMIYNGAEPISTEICYDFISALEVYGLEKSSMYPVYGLAEASLAVSFSKLEDPVVSIGLDRSLLHIGDTISEKSCNENTITFVNVGKPVPYCSLRIVGKNNFVCNENMIGVIQIKGDNVTSGYYNNSTATSQAITADGWLYTGDLGFIHEGCLYITGREKDIIFINGQNYYPHDIERNLEVIDGIELGKVVVAGYTNEKLGEEEVFVFILYKGKIEKFIETHNKAKAYINQSFGFEPNHILPVREIPKTTSGKVQRFKLIEAYNDNKFSNVIEEINQLLQTQEQREIVEPGNNLESRLHKIWSDALSYSNFGITQKFFDIGGNSLKVAQVLSSIHREFGVEFDYNILFEKQTIREIALEIEQHEITQYKAIQIFEKQASYPLSSTQRRLYYLWEVDKSSIAYNIPVAFQIHGNIDTKRLENAINKIIARHEILRASFFMTNGEPTLFINNLENYVLLITELGLASIGAELKKRVKSFDLNIAPLFRIELLKLSNENYILFIDFHHIISDGISISLFIKEINKFYDDEELPELQIQYKDYIFWEKENLGSAKLKKQEKYWLEQFEEELQVLDFPSDYLRPSLIDYRGEKLEFHLDHILLRKLKEFAKQENTSLFALLLAAYNILLSKYTGQEDFVVGIPVSGRSHLQLQPLFGMFVNNLAIRSFPNGDIEFKEYLSQIKNHAIQAINNQDYPFEHLVEQIGQKRDVSRNSLFDTMFIYQNMDMPKIKNKDFTIERYFFDPGFSKYDISLEIFEEFDHIDYYIEYSTALFNKETLLRFANHFENLLNNIVELPNTKLSELSLINKEEYKKIALEFNNTFCDYPNDKVIHQLIDVQMLKNPNGIAVIEGRCDSSNLLSSNQKLSYKELIDKSNQLGNFLRKKGIAQNIPVAIIMDRNPRLIIAILGILKAGGCYLPIDRDLPKERIKYILSDSQTNIVISDARWIKSSNIASSQDLLSELSKSDVKFVDINNPELYSNESTNITNINSPSDLAYIIYTSGTTGNPKGVMIEHQSLVNYASFANKVYIKESKVSFPLYTSISFDLTVTSIFAPLISGNKIITYADNGKTLPIEDVILDNQIDVLKATPSHLKMLKENKLFKEINFQSNIKRIIVGGEALTTQLAKDISHIFNSSDRKVEIYNEYGPTEATVGCMIYKYNEEKDKKQTVPIGIPIDNSQIYLLDKYLKTVPTGVTGEMYISGDCLSRGYLFNPQLTKEKFIDNPFVAGKKLYKTGDLAKILTDGNIEFIGRIDQQVKINGYRIELEEIERQMLNFEDAKEVVVLAKSDKKEEPYLCAYIVLNKQGEERRERESGRNQLTSEINNHLSNYLPHYMIPKYIIPIASIPLTKNGKINYSLLPEVTFESESIKVEASNDIQRSILSVWKDVLGETKIGITDNFFELGGDSIKAVQIASRLFDKNISVNVKDILTCHTVEQLCLHAEITDGSTQYEQGLINGCVELTPIYNWFFKQNFENPHLFNQSVLLNFKQLIDKKILKQTLEFLINHHDALRLQYDNSKVGLYIRNELNREALEISLFDLRGIDKQSQNLKIEESCLKVKSEINIETGPIIKVAIIKKENDQDLLFITIHHLAIDGVSWRIFLEDFYKVYKGILDQKDWKLSRKTASVIDVGTKFKNYRLSEVPSEIISYWEEVQTNEFKIPLDYETDNWSIKDSFICSNKLDKEQTQFLLKGANETYRTDALILINVALARVLAKWTNTNNIVIEQESHGRQLEYIDLTRTVGWFTTMYPLYLKISEDSIHKNIIEIKEQMRKLPNSGYEYGIIKSQQKDVKEKSLSEVRLNYLGVFGQEFENNLFSYSFNSTGTDISPVNRMTSKIEINCMIIEGSLSINIIYNNKAHKKSTIEWLVNAFIDNLGLIFKHLKETGEIYFTESDFDSVLDQDDLDHLLN